MIFSLSLGLIMWFFRTLGARRAAAHATEAGLGSTVADVVHQLGGVGELYFGTVIFATVLFILLGLGLQWEWPEGGEASDDLSKLATLRAGVKHSILHSWVHDGEGAGKAAADSVSFAVPGVFQIQWGGKVIRLAAALGMVVYVYALMIKSM